MNLKNKKGITIIALVITVVIMLILVGVTIKVGTKSIDESEKEDNLPLLGVASVGVDDNVP